MLRNAHKVSQSEPCMWTFSILIFPNKTKQAIFQYSLTNNFDYIVIDCCDNEVCVECLNNRHCRQSVAPSVLTAEAAK